MEGGRKSGFANLILRENQRKISSSIKVNSIWSMSKYPGTSNQMVNTVGWFPLRQILYIQHIAWTSFLIKMTHHLNVHWNEIPYFIHLRHSSFTTWLPAQSFNFNSSFCKFVCVCAWVYARVCLFRFTL